MRTAVIAISCMMLCGCAAVPDGQRVAIYQNDPEPPGPFMGLRSWGRTLSRVWRDMSDKEVGGFFPLWGPPVLGTMGVQLPILLAQDIQMFPADLQRQPGSGVPEADKTPN